MAGRASNDGPSEVDGDTRRSSSKRQLHIRSDVVCWVYTPNHHSVGIAKSHFVPPYWYRRLQYNNFSWLANRLNSRFMDQRLEHVPVSGLKASITCKDRNLVILRGPPDRFI